MFHDNSLKMKKATLILLASAVIAAGSVTLSSCGGGSEGENYIVEDVEGNTLIMTTGLRVKMLGIKDGSKQAEQFVRNNCIGEEVVLVQDQDGEEIEDVDSEVHRYVIRPEKDDVCLNTQIIDQYRMDVWSPEFVTDSLDNYLALVKKDKSVTEIPYLALYMKQRTFLIEVPGGIGTGFFINDQGLAITNNHVLADANGVVWLYSDDPDDAKVYTTKRRGIKRVDWTNPTLDITIFTVDLDKDEEVPYFNLADRHAKQGDYCATLGNPHGLTASFSGGGQVAAYREDPYENRGVTVMQYTIPTNGGNSGGPVCLPNGLVYAVHEMGDKTMQNTNYGIDILHVREVLDREGLKYGGK